jgi:4-oxalocrotonate tautomerase
MPVVHIEMMAGRTEDQKRAMVARVTDVLVETIAAPPEAVQIVVTEVQPEQWAVAGQLVADQRAATA